MMDKIKRYLKCKSCKKELTYIGSINSTVVFACESKSCKFNGLLRMAMKSKDYSKRKLKEVKEWEN